MNCMIVFRSMTHAQSAGSVLRRSGLSASMAKPPTGLGRGSCAYGLVLPSSQLPAALNLLHKTSLPLVGVYDMLPGGGWREVVL